MVTEDNISVRKVIVIYNPRSGTLLAAGEDPEANLRKLFEDRDVKPELHPFDLKALPNILASAKRNAADAIIVCGGDGTILAVAAALGDSKLPLGLLPGGTMNILARDLGVPMELEAAANVTVAGKIKAIDMGYVNGQPFLCNSAIGLMPHLARTREQLREISWWRKWPKWLLSFLG